MTTPLSFSKFPFSGDVLFFEIGFMKSSLDRSASKINFTWIINNTELHRYIASSIHFYEQKDIRSYIATM